MRILVVEDDVAMAAALNRALHAAGVVADIAGTRSESVGERRQGSGLSSGSHPTPPKLLASLRGVAEELDVPI